MLRIKYNRYGKILDIELTKTKYSCGNRLAVTMIDHTDGYPEPWDVLTVNLEKTLDDTCCAFINTNDVGAEICSLLIREGIAFPTQRECQSGFCRYPEFRFTEQALSQMEDAYL